jgi:hypothetical protein
MKISTTRILAAFFVILSIMEFTGCNNLALYTEMMHKENSSQVTFPENTIFADPDTGIRLLINEQSLRNNNKEKGVSFAIPGTAKFIVTLNKSKYLNDKKPITPIQYVIPIPTGFLIRNNNVVFEISNFASNKVEHTPCELFTHEDYGYLIMNDVLYCMNYKNDTLIWYKSLSDSNYSISPVQVYDNLIVNGEDTILIFNPRNGELKFRFEFQDAMVDSVQRTDDIIWILTHSKESYHVYRFDIPKRILNSVNVSNMLTFYPYGTNIYVIENDLRTLSVYDSMTGVEKNKIDITKFYKDAMFVVENNTQSIPFMFQSDKNQYLLNPIDLLVYKLPDNLKAVDPSLPISRRDYYFENENRIQGYDIFAGTETWTINKEKGKKYKVLSSSIYAVLLEEDNSLKMYYLGYY